MPSYLRVFAHSLLTNPLLIQILESDESGERQRAFDGFVLDWDVAHIFAIMSIGTKH